VTMMQKVFWFTALVVLPALTYIALTIWSPAIYIAGFFAVLVAIGLYDLYFSPHTLNRLYPVAAYIRYGLEFIRPEIHQYFVAGDKEEFPFNREQRNLVYRRAKGLDDTKPFGVQADINEAGYLGAAHSIMPVTVREELMRVTVGGDRCKQPYNASRLNVSAMSFGALSGNAILALNKGAKRGNFAHNTGEGGLSPHHQAGGGDIIWQIGTGYFGCRSKDSNFDPDQFAAKATLEQVKMIEIKISQGAKPSHGGVLPAAKVSQEIADIRGVEPGKDVLSPPAHTAFDTPMGLLSYISQLRELSGGKPVGFKLCIGRPYEFMAICKAMLETGDTPDFITVDGAEGGTGAAPVEYSNRFGAPCLEAVYFVHNCLVGCGLREQVKLIASGKTASAFDMVTKLAAGADMVNAARTMMMALGCIQSQACNTNRCPTGVATQDPQRGKALDVESKHIRVANFHATTLKTFFDMVGAMGLDDPGLLEPSHFWRRVGDGSKRTFDEIYPSLQENELLHDNSDHVYKREWMKASALSFHIQD
jgi:glutamate synthase domain-containing protein 2